MSGPWKKKFNIPAMTGAVAVILFLLYTSGYMPETSSVDEASTFGSQREVATEVADSLFSETPATVPDAVPVAASPVPTLDEWLFTVPADTGLVRIDDQVDLGGSGLCPTKAVRATYPNAERVRRAWQNNVSNPANQIAIAQTVSRYSTSEAGQVVPMISSAVTNDCGPGSDATAAKALAFNVGDDSIAYEVTLTSGNGTTVYAWVITARFGNDIVTVMAVSLSDAQPSEFLLMSDALLEKSAQL